MLSRFFLILAGLFAGLWLNDSSGTLFNIAFPALSLVALLFAVAAAPPSIDRDARARLEDAYRQWLDAWLALRGSSGQDRTAAESALASARHRIALMGSDRVVKSLQVAASKDLTPAAVADLLMDMRRSLRRAGVTVRPADLEALLAPGNEAPAARAGRAAPQRAASPASFLT